MMRNFFALSATSSHGSTGGSSDSESYESKAPIEDSHFPFHYMGMRNEREKTCLQGL